MALLIGSSSWPAWVIEGQQPLAGDHHLDCLGRKLEVGTVQVQQQSDTSKQDALDPICQAASTTFPLNAPKPTYAPHFVMAGSYHPTTAVDYLVNQFLPPCCALTIVPHSWGPRKRNQRGGGRMGLPTAEQREKTTNSQIMQPQIFG